MAKIDTEELIKRIQNIDPFWCSGVGMKWKIIKLIKKMEKEQNNDETKKA